MEAGLLSQGQHSLPGVDCEELECSLHRDLVIKPVKMS